MSVRRVPSPRLHRPNRPCTVEAVEARVLFHLEVQTAIPNQFAPANSAPTVVDVSQNIFNEETGPTVRMNYGTLGNIDILLLERQAPLSVANFLKYVNEGTFNGTIIHRSEPNFVIQGGGFKPNGDDITGEGTPTVPNEFSPTRSNIRGTVAYAKLGGDADSATSEFFYNLNNNASNLDNQNGGFTVFGRVSGGGMAVADAIAALQRVNASPINGALNHLPVTRITNPTLTPVDAAGNGPAQTPQADQMVILQSATVIAPATPVTFSATSDNPTLVSPTFNGSALTLSYGAGLTGKATVTVTATESGTGTVVTDTFVVNVGNLNVPVGPGAVQSLTFTDADGTTAFIRVRRGDVQLSFRGVDFEQTPTRNGATLTGTGIVLDDMTILDGNPIITIKTSNGDQLLSVGALSGPAGITNFNAPGIVLSGTGSLPGSIGRMTVAQLQGVNLSVGGAIQSLRVLGDVSGSLTADSIRSLQAGSLTGASLTLTQVSTGRAVALNSLRAGAVTNSHVRADAGNLGTITVDSISGSTIFAGTNPSDGSALPDATDDFVNESSIRGVTVRNRSTESFSNTDIAAASLGRMSLGVINTANNAVPFGLAARTIRSIIAADQGGAPIRRGRLSTSAQNFTSGDFNVLLFEAPPPPAPEEPPAAG